MKRKDFFALRSKDNQELEKLLSQLEKEAVNINLSIAMRKEKNTGSRKGKKKDIARILTILRERNLKDGKIS